ncbi:MAG: YqgE/AlgH family protein [Planctomycetales bacterium]|nr:YqgE/AlgH family protein [Planctomycetales bacterium]
MGSVQGKALVASPYLTDPHFLRSVVYVLQHDDQGAIGLLLNRPTNRTIGELLRQLSGDEFSNHAHVYWGGPVDGPVMLLQVCHDPQGVGVYAASDPEQILRIVANPECSELSNYRLFDGYSGWGAGQLEDELKAGGWLVWDIEPGKILADSDDLWESAVKAIGRDILAGGIDPSKMPEDPAYN